MPLPLDRKSTRLNSSHSVISYAVFCLKKKTREVSATVTLGNIVGEAENLLLVGIIPLHRDFHGDAFLLRDRVERRPVEYVLALVAVLDEPFHTPGVCEIFLLPSALVDQLDLHAVVEERELSQALCQDVEVVFDDAERIGASQKMHLGAASLGFAGHSQRRDRHTAPKFHKVALPVASNGKA